MSRQDPSRRDFLRSAALAGAGMAALGLEGCKRPGEAAASETTPAAVAQNVPAADPPGGKVRVVLVKDSAAVANGEINASALPGMLERGLKALSGADSAAEAWRKYVSPDEVIGLKINCLFGPGVSTHPEVTEAVVGSLQAAGFPADKLIVWDADDGHMKRAGYTINRDGPGVRCKGTSWYHEDQPRQNGAFNGRLSRILTEDNAALINLPILKHHGMSGVTISMKNHYGTCHNPGDHHDNHCNPAIADLCALEPIKAKTRLIICDALVPQCDGGPGLNPGAQWVYGGLLLSTNMVALDYWGWRIIEARRRETGLGSLESVVGHIASAAERGLGPNDPNRIDLIEV